MNLDGKFALVTGAARGIGRGCALELARAGANVAVNDRSRTPQAEAVVAEIQAMGRQAILGEGDVFERVSCESVLTQTPGHFGRIDILVSNPAFSRRGDFLDYDPDLFAKTLQGTLAGGFHMSQLVARHMVERGKGGSLVAMASTAAIEGAARSSHYGASKGGVCAMVRALAVELARYKITANSILPGWIETEMTANAFGNEKFAGNVMPRIPERRWGVGADFGPIAVYLASGATGYTTGRDFVIDGGYTLF